MCRPFGKDMPESGLWLPLWVQLAINQTGEGEESAFIRPCCAIQCCALGAVYQCNNIFIYIYNK